MGTVYLSNRRQLEAQLNPRLLAGVDRTLDAAVTEGKRRCPVDTGRARQSIRRESAQLVGSSVRGSFGSYGDEVPYMWWIETGTSRMPARAPLRGAATAVFPRFRQYLR